MLDCKYPVGIAFPMWCFDSDQIVVFITQNRNLIVQFHQGDVDGVRYHTPGCVLPLGLS